MAGKRIVTPAELEAACQEYASRRKLEVSKGENGSLCLMPGDILVSLEEGRPKTENSELLEGITLILMDMAGAPISPKIEDFKGKKTNMPATIRNGSNGRMMPSGLITAEDIRDYLCPKASPQEILMAAKMCEIKGMNWGDVHFIKYGDAPLTIVAGKEFFMKKAESHKDFAGFQAGIIIKNQDGTTTDLEGTFYLDGELVGGWAKVYRNDRKEPFVQRVKLSAFDTKKALWAKMPEVMIRKVALVNASREAFPGTLGGIYDSSEMGQAVDTDFEEVISPS